MRRWVCIVALLAGFGGQDYIWSARRPLPVAISRPLETYRGPDGLATTADWWRCG
jgi:hypothetical protein